MTEVVMQEQVVNGKYASGFQLGLLTKDVKIAETLTRDLKFDAPLVRFVSERFSKACNELGYARDNTEAIKVWDKDG